MDREWPPPPFEDREAYLAWATRNHLRNLREFAGRLERGEIPESLHSLSNADLLASTKRHIAEVEAYLASP